MKHHCHACGYDRSGDHAPVCPECGTANTDPATADRSIGGLLSSAAACCLSWIFAYTLLVRYTHDKGVYIGYDLPFFDRLLHDRGWMVAIASGAAVSLIVVFLLWKRRIKVASWPQSLRLVAGAIAGLGAAFHVVDLSSVRY